MIRSVSSRTAATGSPSSLTRSAGRPCARSVSQVARRLGGDQRPERVAGVGDVDVALRIVDELQEAAGRRAALVQLSGRVQEARAVPERGGRAGGGADRVAQLGDRGVELVRRRHVAHDRDVVRRACVGQQRAQLLVAGGLELGDRSGVEHPLGVVLGLLHVGLVERVDLERPARHRDRELGQEEDPAEVGGPVRGQRERRMPGRADLLDERVQALLGLLEVAQVQEHPVVAVGVGRVAERLVANRHDPAPLLAGRLGDELLGPQPEALDRVRDDERELVAALERELAERRSLPQARVRLARVVVGAHLLGDLAAVKQRL